MMYKLCKSEQSARRQRDLETGLLAAMGSQHYDSITVSSLCEQLNLPRKSFYRYFDSKEGAFHALLDHTLEDCIRLVDSSVTHRESLEQYFTFWLGQKPLLDALSRSGLSGEIVQRTTFMAIQDQGFAGRILRNFPETELEHAALFIISGLMALVLQWHHGGYRMTPAQMARSTVTLLTTPLLSL